jgi:fatty acid-binding protein DegV
MSVQQKPIGKTKVALDKMVAQIKGDKDRLDTDCIFITHSIAPESAVYLNEVLKKEFPGVPVYETMAGCVISSHCGKGCIGILYMVK